MESNDWKVVSRKKIKRRKGYGGIIKVFSETLNTFEYVIVQGRETGIWSFPKGHFDNDNESPLECALREIKEETGLYLEDIEPVCKFGKYFIFELNEKLVLEPQDTVEISQAIWITIENMKKLKPNNNGIREFLKKCNKYF